MLSFAIQVTSSVSGRTDVLLCGKEPGYAKVSKARTIPKCKLMTLMDLKSGIEGPSLEAVLPMAPITNFSNGYKRSSGYNGLALQASPAALAIASGSVAQISAGAGKAALPPPADGDVEIVKEQTFEDSLRIQREEAKLTGRYIILEAEL